MREDVGGVDTVGDLRMLRDEQRPGLDAVDRHRADHHGGDGVARNAERHDGDQRAADIGVIGRFRCDNAFRRAGAELLRGASRISWPGRRPAYSRRCRRSPAVRRWRCRQGSTTTAGTGGRGFRRSPAGATPTASARSVSGFRRARGMFCFSTSIMICGNAKIPISTGRNGKPPLRNSDPKVKRGTPPIGSVADDGDQQPERGRDQAFHHRGFDQACDHRHRKHE